MKHVEGILEGFDGCRLYYQNWQPEEPCQAIVVLVHGLGGHSGSFQNVVDYLVAQSYEVYALDLRGHGRSQGQRGHIDRWQEFREDLHSLLQEIHLHRSGYPCILWGHSLGGTIVLDYVLRRPELISGAIVTAPALGRVNVAPFKLAIGRLMSRFFPRFTLKLGLQREGDTPPTAARIAYFEDPLRHECASARLATEFFEAVDWIYEHAAEMRIPLLIMHGSADRVTLPEGSRAFFQRAIYPDKEHLEYADRYHDLFFGEDYRQIFTDLEIWLDCHLKGTNSCQPFLDSTFQQATLVPLGHTLPALLDRACDRIPNATAFNQWTDRGWRSLSNQAFKLEVEFLAMGLVGLGLEKGDRVGLLMRSDLKFAIADLGCLLAGLADVPLDLSQTLEHIFFALAHSGAKALVVSDLDLLRQIAPYLDRAPALRSIILAEVPPNWSDERSQLLEGEASAPDLDPIPAEACLNLHFLLFGRRATRQEFALPPDLKLLAWDEVRTYGRCRQSPESLLALRSRTIATDLATLIYIPDETGQLVGVMLTHENLSGNAVAAFASMPNLEWGDREVVLSFLPLNHVFARCMLYGHLYYGHSIYFSHPNRVFKHLGEVQPTIFATVPLLLERFYSKIAERGEKLPSWLQRQIFNWAWKLAHRHPMGKPARGLAAVALNLADRLVYIQWREVFGNRLKYLLSGGAALRADLANAFNVAGIPVCQGYGLTQTSGVVAFNRSDNNRAGTVGSPIPGVEISIADDGEILVRGLYVTPGYYDNPESTQAAIDDRGWLRTGDLGKFTDRGLLQITGFKKSLFKLSTGKYIAPQLLEDRLVQSPTIRQAIVVGADRKSCAALIVPDRSVLRDRARGMGFDGGDLALLQHPCLLPLFQAEIDALNCHLPYWGKIKRFQLIDTELTLKNGLLTADGKIDRAAVNERFKSAIDALYREGNLATPPPVPVPSMEEVSCPVPPAIACPTFTQSLQP